ncbi:DUF3325 family protein [Xylophilus sp.]|uniref:DUF3325 family protein n=1 Tax=Xylophilus sp. TaxID=2653893 RepID=UPI0013BD8E0F|nr:DUF3325 family protein [Xylophilus sp.]KAF1049578.1 MAG: hypothetical protein GAK38_00677 [Xylophilus sp.]
MTGHVVCLLLSLPAFACLALAMERHQQDVLGRALAPGATRTLRLAGWALLAASLAVALGTPAGATWSLGLVAWFGHIAAAAAVVLLALVVNARRKARPS